MTPAHGPRRRAFARKGPTWQCYPYGRSAAGPFKVTREEQESGRTTFALAGWQNPVHAEDPRRRTMC